MNATLALSGEKVTEKMVVAAYRISSEVGRELEVILRRGPTPERLASLQTEITVATSDRATADRVFQAIVTALYPPQ
ncbi:MAG TPA: hypothetical protein VKU44_09015 [Terriglobia bacterium]|nr:hypothetical protein [Terriglobia bacterium]